MYELYNLYNSRPDLYELYNSYASSTSLPLAPALAGDFVKGDCAGGRDVQ